LFLEKLFHVRLIKRLHGREDKFKNPLRADFFYGIFLRATAAMRVVLLPGLSKVKQV